MTIINLFIALCLFEIVKAFTKRLFNAVEDAYNYTSSVYDRIDKLEDTLKRGNRK